MVVSIDARSAPLTRNQYVPRADDRDTNVARTDHAIARADSRVTINL
jgi:hypothetical protein